MPNKRQAITWTKADPIHLRIDAALGGDQLNNTSSGMDAIMVPVVWILNQFADNIEADTI